MITCKNRGWLGEKRRERRIIGIGVLIGVERSYRRVIGG
jgi:hypothetical protein